MAGYIDPSFEGNENINDAQRVQIEKYGFEVRPSVKDPAHFEVVDPELRKFRGVGASKYGPSGNLEILLIQAVGHRKQHETAVANGNSATKESDAPERPENVGEAKSEAAPKASSKAPAVKKPRALPAKAATTKGKVAKSDAPKAAAAELTVDGDALDNTGKRRERAKKMKEPKVRGPNRYLRAYRVIFDHPELAKSATDEASLKRGSDLCNPTMAPHTFSRAVDAWNALRDLYREKGLEFSLSQNASQDK